MIDKNLLKIIDGKVAYAQWRVEWTEHVIAENKDYRRYEWIYNEKDIDFWKEQAKKKANIHVQVSNIHVVNIPIPSEINPYRGQKWDGDFNELLALLNKDVDALRKLREKECFNLYNRRYPEGKLTAQQEQELDTWYAAWLDVTQTKVIPQKPAWLV